MTFSEDFLACLAAAQNTLAANESIVQFRLGAPQMGRPDYFMRFKAYVGVLDPSSSSVTGKRNFLVTKSSNTGTIAIDTATPFDASRAGRDW